jgi:hypothetical protein
MPSRAAGSTLRSVAIRFQSPKTCFSSSCGIGGYFRILKECTSLKRESTNEGAAASRGKLISEKEGFE